MDLAKRAVRCYRLPYKGSGRVSIRVLYGLGDCVSVKFILQTMVLIIIFTL